MSRNKDRVGGTKRRDTSPPPQVTQPADGGGFAFVVPTEFVELPSGGRFYADGHPLHGVESIEIRQMTAKEEDILTSRTLLKKGVALDRVIKNIIVDGRVDPDSLLVGDRNAIIVSMRVSGYGNDYTTKVACPACLVTQDYGFDLNEANIYEGGNFEELDITDNEDGTFDVTVPASELNITFRLLTGHDEKNLLNGITSDRKRKVDERGITRQLRNILVAINGSDDSDMLDYASNNLPSRDSRHLRLAYRLVAPNVDLTQNFVCEECGEEQDMEVPLSADFFWPDR